jgi:signal transduction histidine kinase
MAAGLLLLITVRHEQRQAAETALTQARSNFQRDVIYRHWNAAIGPLYVPLGPGVQPNPYLADVPDRDVITTQGMMLTMVNPAYMTRLVYELAARDYGVRGHITSLRPVRPENSPDPWEAGALRAFERGAPEVSSLELMEGASYLRMMKPLRTERECLYCHKKHGYAAGDIRGGISVSVPMAPLERISRRNIVMSAASFSVLWLAGLGGILAGAARLHRAIGERDRAEQEIVILNQDLLERKAELETANRELDAFSSAISHDLRSPLSTISGFTELIRELPAGDHQEKREKYTNSISRECGRMDTLISTLLEFSRLSRAEPRREPVDLSAMAAEIAADLRQRDPGRSVAFRIEAGATATGDSALLRIVMQNLLGNAWKYTSKRGEALIEFGSLERNGKKIFFVRDNGAGFDQAEAGRVFEAFHRLHSDKEFTGTGIGLATVKRIISRHNGRIWAEGEVGKGATISFTVGPAGSETQA